MDLHNINYYSFFIAFILIYPDKEKDTFSYLIVSLVVIFLIIINILITLILSFLYVFLVVELNLFYPNPINIEEKILDLLIILIFSVPFISLFVIYSKVNLEKIVDSLESNSLESTQCRGRDLNPRSPTTRDLKSRSFDLTRIPLQHLLKFLF